MSEGMMLLTSMAILCSLVIIPQGVEAFGHQFFWRILFTAGMRVHSEARPLPQPELPSGTVFETQNGRFKVINQRECLFYETRGGFRQLIDTQNGILVWTDGQATAEVRIPFTAILQRVAAILLLVVLSSLFWSTHTFREILFDRSTMMIVVAIMACLFALTVSSKKSWGKSILDEYEAYVTEKREGHQTQSPRTSDAPR